MKPEDLISSSDTAVASVGPATSTAMTAAERARRYRAKRKAAEEGAPLPGAAMKERLIALQMQYDREHQTVMELESQLYSLRVRAVPEQANPLAAQVRALRALVSKQDSMISSLNAEVARLRDASKSHKP